MGKKPAKAPFDGFLSPKLAAVCYLKDRYAFVAGKILDGDGSVLETSLPNDIFRIMKYYRLIAVVKADEPENIYQDFQDPKVPIPRGRKVMCAGDIIVKRTDVYIVKGQGFAKVKLKLAGI